jgi:FkbM family methyltransferase
MANSQDVCNHHENRKWGLIQMQKQMQVLVKNLAREAVFIYQSKGIFSGIKRTVRYLINWKRSYGDFKWFVITSARQSRPVVAVHGQKMGLHPSDPGLSRELATYGIHEPTATELLRGFIHEGMKVVDLGANIGYYALLEAQLVGQQGQVLAIEPALENYELLLYNIELNRVKNIQMAPPCAIGSTDTVGKLYIGGSANWHSLMPNLLGGDPSAYVEVPLRTLDSLVKEVNFPRVDLLRMDIEGYEVEAVKGMWHTLETFRPRLMIELHYCMTTVSAMNELLTSLKSLGYYVEYLLDRDLDYPWLPRQEVGKKLPLSELITEKPAYRVVMCFLTAEKA